MCPFIPGLLPFFLSNNLSQFVFMQNTSFKPPENTGQRYKEKLGVLSFWYPGELGNEL